LPPGAGATLHLVCAVLAIFISKYTKSSSMLHRHSILFVQAPVACASKRVHGPLLVAYVYVPVTCPGVRELLL